MAFVKHIPAVNPAQLLPGHAFDTHLGRPCDLSQNKYLKGNKVELVSAEVAISYFESHDGFCREQVGLGA